MKMHTMLAIGAAAMFAVLAPVHAQDAKQDPKQEAKPDYSRCMEVQGTADYNFGKIDADGSVEHTFLIKNTCNQVVELDNPRASCGCTAALLSEKTIQPGEEAKIQVKFTPPKGTRGKVSKNVSVYAKGDPNPIHVLRFSADVKTDIEINPSYVNLLGAEVGKPVSGTSTFKNVTEADIEVSEIALQVNAYADTTTTPGAQPSSVMKPMTNGKVTPTSMKLKPGEEKTITVTLTPEWKGQINGSIRYKTAKGDGMVQIFGIVRPKPAPNVITKPN